MAVDIRIDGAIAVLTLNRPGALNAFDSAQIERVVEVFRSLKEHREIRAVILTGAGDRAFAAGADIKEMAELTEAEGLAFGRRGHVMALAIETLPQPVIAAVNGFALGGGCEVALACDIRIASDRAVFAQPEVGLGIPPGWGGTQRLTRLVGAGLAAELILTGRRVKAEEALRIGLVNAVHPPDELMAKATGLAEAIAKNGPVAVRNAKRLMQLAYNGQLGLVLETELQLFGRAFGTSEQREGMRAFLDKRPAVFSDD